MSKNQLPACTLDFSKRNKKDSKKKVDKKKEKMEEKEQAHHNVFRIKSDISFELLKNSKPLFRVKFQFVKVVLNYFVQIISIDNFHVLNSNFVLSVILAFAIKIITKQKFNFIMLVIVYLAISFIFALIISINDVIQYRRILNRIQKANDLEGCLVAMTEFLQDEYLLELFTRKNGERSYTLLILKNIMAMRVVDAMLIQKGNGPKLIYNSGLFELEIGGAIFYAFEIESNEKDFNFIEIRNDTLKFKFIYEDFIQASGNLIFDESLFYSCAKNEKIACASNEFISK